MQAVLPYVYLLSIINKQKKTAIKRPFFLEKFESFLLIGRDQDSINNVNYAVVCLNVEGNNAIVLSAPVSYQNRCSDDSHCYILSL